MTSLPSGLNPLTTVGRAGVGQVSKVLKEDNVVEENIRGTKLEEKVHETNKRQLREGMIDPETAIAHGETARESGSKISETKAKSTHNPLAMRKAHQNEKTLKNIDKEQNMVDSVARDEQNRGLAADVVEEAKQMKASEGSEEASPGA